jgi:hypothetical protein
MSSGDYGAAGQHETADANRLVVEEIVALAVCW